MDISRLQTTCRELQMPFPLLFATVSGAHLYGFPSEDSDFDVRGAHVAPAAEVLSLNPPRETLEIMEERSGLELDLVTHDVKKFFQLLLNRNGYVLEQVFSPLVVQALPQFHELKSIAVDCITRSHGRHFLGFAERQMNEIYQKGKTTTKKLLYMFRVLLAGIHLMRVGRVESNLVTLNQEQGLSYLKDLIELKINGNETMAAHPKDLEFYHEEYQRLRNMLTEAMTSSGLPDEPSCGDRLNDLLIRLRLTAP